MTCDFKRLEYAIHDAFESEPIRIEIAAARAYQGAPLCGIILTDFYADEPGQGTGGRVLPILVDMCHDLELPIYLSPSCPDAKRFYEKHGFETTGDCKRHFGCMANLPPVPEWAREAA